MTSMYSFTEQFAAPQGSPIRELFKYLAQPGMISFAGGYPAPSLFDSQGLARSAAAAMREYPAACLQYGATEGDASLNQALRMLMQERGIAAQAEQLLITTGSQQAFELLLRVLVAPGDCIAIERPAYPAAIQALRIAGANICALSSDAGGLDVDAFEQQLEQGLRPRLLYLVPTFANPSGATLTLARRKKLLALAIRYRMLVVEDDPYGELRFSGAPLPTLYQLAQEIPGAAEWLIYLSSLSKIVAPGLRIGWLLAPAEIRRRAVIAKQTSDLCTAPWMQLTAAHYLSSGQLAPHMAKLIAAYRLRCDTMLTALRQQFGAALEVVEPEGGMFIWARWHNRSDATQLLQTAIAENVLYVPGSAFFADRPDPASLRLSFAMAEPEAIADGVKRLKTAYERFMSSSEKNR